MRFWPISATCRNCKKRLWKSAITFLLSNIMASQVQVRCKVIEITLLYQNLFAIGDLLWFLARHWVKNPYRSIVLLIKWRHCDVVVDVLSSYFSGNVCSSISYYILLRLNVIYMVRKIGQFVVHGGGVSWLTPAPSFCLILETRR